MSGTVRELEDKFEEAVGVLGSKGRRMLALLTVRLRGERGGRRTAVALFGLRGEPAFSLEVEFPGNTLERITASDLADALAEQVLGDARRFAEPRERRDAEALLGEGGAAVVQASRRMPFKNLDEILEFGADASPLFEAHISVSDRARPGEGLLEYLWHSGRVVRGTVRLWNREASRGEGDGA